MDIIYFFISLGFFAATWLTMRGFGKLGSE